MATGMRRRGWKIVLALMVVMALVLGARRIRPAHRRVHPRYASYWDKPARYLIMDALIVFSPFNALLGFVFMLDPVWRDRPHDWRDPEECGPPVHRAVRRSFYTIATFFGLAGLGLLIFLAHTLDLIP
jgi:hypothetical protein